MLSVERRPAYWNGDLRTFSTRSWAEDSEIAGIAIAADGQGRAWLNLRHCHPGTSGLLWLHLRRQSVRHPLVVVHARELAALAAALDREAEAG